MSLVGRVSELRRYPVKSMLGETLDVASIAARGVAGDRAYALVDVETGKLVSAKRPKRWGRILELTASTSDGDGDGVCVAFPDGETFAIDAPALRDRLHEFFGRRVEVASVPPTGATYDEVWERDLKNGVDPYVGLSSHVEEGDELIEYPQFLSGPSNFFDFGTLHLITTSTCRQLAALAPNSRFDSSRFRPNIVIDTDESGFPETNWVGQTVTIGATRLTVSMSVPRCVMTTLAQGELPADRDVLRTIAEHNSLDPGLGTPYPCVGVYADVELPGDIQLGDAVTLP
jgi:MOSC domain-containing protein